MCDLCVRYTSMVDRYIPNISLCLKDPHPFIRKQTLILLTNLLQVNRGSVSHSLSSQCIAYTLIHLHFIRKTLNYVSCSCFSLLAGQGSYQGHFMQSDNEVIFSQWVPLFSPSVSLNSLHSCMNEYNEHRSTFFSHWEGSRCLPSPYPCGARQGRFGVHLTPRRVVEEHMCLRMLLLFHWDLW